MTAEPEPAPDVIEGIESIEAIESIEVRNLVKTYPGVVALDGADVSIPGGNVLGLLGKNGAGKSTLIKVLAGAVSPTAARSSSMAGSVALVRLVCLIGLTATGVPSGGPSVPGPSSST